MAVATKPRTAKVVGPFERHELPSGQVIFYRDSDHSYWTEAVEKKGGVWSGKGRLTGASTIAKALDFRPDNLMGWAAKLEAEGACQLLSGCPTEQVDVLLAGGGEALHRELVESGYDWRSVRDRRGQEGTNVHELIFRQLAEKGTANLAKLSKTERGYGQGVFKFWRDTEPETIAVEQVIYSEELGYTGRFDLLATLTKGRFAGRTAILDSKTRPSRFVSLSDHVQLAGYLKATPECGVGEPDLGLIILLPGDGSYELIECQASAEHFATALASYRAASSIGKAMRAAAKNGGAS